MITPTGAPVLKATTFVTRDRNHSLGAGQIDLLLLHHPQAGIQIPAGTVELGEAPAAAALREAAEETGLHDLTLVREVGVEDDPPPPGYGITALNSPVHLLADPESASWGTLRRGLLVELLRAEGEFVQINYTTMDRRPDPQYVSFTLTGWVAAAAVTLHRRRHFYHLHCTAPTPPSWEVLDEQYRFTLAWHPITALPPIIPPQDQWLRWLPDLPY